MSIFCNFAYQIIWCQETRCTAEVNFQFFRAIWNPPLDWSFKIIILEWWSYSIHLSPTGWKMWTHLNTASGLFVLWRLDSSLINTLVLTVFLDTPTIRTPPRALSRNDIIYEHGARTRSRIFYYLPLHSGDVSMVMNIPRSIIIFFSILVRVIEILMRSGIN